MATVLQFAKQREIQALEYLNTLVRPHWYRRKQSTIIFDLLQQYLDLCITLFIEPDHPEINEDKEVYMEWEEWLINLCNTRWCIPKERDTAAIPLPKENWRGKLIAMYEECKDIHQAAELWEAMVDVIKEMTDDNEFPDIIIMSDNNDELTVAENYSERIYKALEDQYDDMEDMRNIIQGLRIAEDRFTRELDEFIDDLFDKGGYEIGEGNQSIKRLLRENEENKQTIKRLKQEVNSLTTTLEELQDFPEELKTQKKPELPKWVTGMVLRSHMHPDYRVIFGKFNPDNETFTGIKAACNATAQDSNVGEYFDDAYISNFGIY